VGVVRICKIGTIGSQVLLRLKVDAVHRLDGGGLSSDGLRYSRTHSKECFVRKGKFAISRSTKDHQSNLVIGCIFNCSNRERELGLDRRETG
jgi:hypothetical protein